MNCATYTHEDIAAKMEIKMKKMADEYGMFTKEEIIQAYNEMERMNIGIFVTQFDNRQDDIHTK